MGKKKLNKRSAMATLAEVTKEMAKPILAMSARERSYTNEVLVVKNDVEK